MSVRTWSRVCPVCRARISSIWLRTRWISAAWISRSDTWPPGSPDGWWMSTREYGSARRLPGVTAASRTAAAAAAWGLPTVWMAGRTGREQDGGGGGGRAHADGLDVGPDEHHRVVDGHQRGERATGRVDVDGDVAVGVVGLQRDQLGHHVVGRRVVDLHPEEDDALLEELVVRVGLLDAVARALDEGRKH